MIALVTGIVMVAAILAGSISIVHKVAAGAFVVAYIANFVVSKK